MLGTLAVGGCSTQNSKYDFEGKIGKDYVKFENSWGFLKGSKGAYLRVEKPNGKIIEYRDYLGNGDLKLEEVDITTKNGETKVYYSHDKLEKTVMDSAQVEFDRYLKLIGKKITEEGLKNLKE